MRRLAPDDSDPVRDARRMGDPVARFGRSPGRISSVDEADVGAGVRTRSRSPVEQPMADMPLLDEDDDRIEVTPLG